VAFPFGPLDTEYMPNALVSYKFSPIALCLKGPAGKVFVFAVGFRCL
jgi:hypothetical protein